MTRYSDETQLTSVWLEMIEFVRDKLRTMRTAGMLEGIASDDHIEIRKLPFVTDTDLADHKLGIFVCPAPEQRYDVLSNNVNQGLRLGVLVSGWSASDGDLFGDMGRILSWRMQLWNPENGINAGRYALASKSVYAEIEPGPVFDPAAWAEGIDSGASRPLDIDEIKAKARDRLSATRQAK